MGVSLKSVVACILHIYMPKLYKESHSVLGSPAQAHFLRIIGMMKTCDTIKYPQILPDCIVVDDTTILQYYGYKSSITTF